MNTVYTITKVECLKCGHKWPPRREGRPLLCPVCKSRTWDEPPKVPKLPKGEKYTATEQQLVDGVLKIMRHGTLEQRKLTEQFVAVMEESLPKPASGTPVVPAV